MTSRSQNRPSPPRGPVDAPAIAETPSLIMIQFLDWVASRPRRRKDVMDAWRSSCPRFPVWEDARAEGFVRQYGGDRGEHHVELTDRGRALLEICRD